MYMYSSKNLNAPQLNNQWGDFNKVINYILDGGSDVPVTKIEYFETNKIKITMESSVFAQHETIEITGATVQGYNLRYFVDSVNSVDNTAILISSLIVSDLGVDSSINIKAKIIKCGMTKKFGGVAENRTVFKSANGMEYRIDDRNYAQLLSPPVEFNEGWQKICRVSMSTNYDSLDSTNEKIVPYNSARPNENFVPDGNYIGERFFIYNQIYTDTASAYDGLSVVGTNFPRGKTDYYIFANSQVIYIFILNPVNYNLNHQYVIGEYNTNKNIKTAIIYSHKYQYPYTSPPVSDQYANNMSNMARSTYDAQRTNTQLCKVSGYNSASDMVIYDRADGNMDYVFLNSNSQINVRNTGGLYSSGVGGDIMADGITYFSDVLLSKVYSDPYSTSSYITNVFGNLIDIKWINGGLNANTFDSVKLNDNNLYKISKTTKNAVQNHANSMFLIRLDMQ